MSYGLLWSEGPKNRAQRVEFYQYWVGSGQVLKKSQIVGGLGLGRRCEIFDQVFPGLLFTLGYVWICRVYPDIWGI